mgnify:CR=1 FL=1
MLARNLRARENSWIACSDKYPRRYRQARRKKRVCLRGDRPVIGDKPIEPLGVTSERPHLTGNGISDFWSRDYRLRRKVG